ncbi:Efflux pump azaL [Mycena sanguinolenta]|uniref:Efflux pump azaL n=1 Tax=Mycena sanguinolenta TaxID=230812 RepID=A0A8H6YT46_9AGAR|nr:Efflux pump azaL [Mycena sanguinolenta]
MTRFASPYLPRTTSRFDMEDSEPTERTALLPKSENKSTTPLPKLQLAVIMFVQICEPAASQSIYPYVNQLVSELDIIGGDYRKVGYYAGLKSLFTRKADENCTQESLFHITEAMTVLQWSRASDHVGRKPILLIGLFGTSVSMLCFGMSRTFWALVVSRCLTGLLNGNVGVMKSVMGDLTDRSNRAQALAFLPIVWDLGAAFGQFMGGQLSQPQRRFPAIFPGQFWKEYPYFLPSLATGGLVALSGLMVFFCFKETAPNKKVLTDEQDCDRSVPSPVPLRELLTFSRRDICVELCRRGLSGPLCPRTGAMSMFLLIFALLPFISTMAAKSGLSATVWALVGCLVSFSVVADMCFGAVFMFLLASAPKTSRGAVNGLGQTSVSVARAIGPVLATSLFSLSVHHNLLCGHAVYVVFSAISLGAITLTTRLPVTVWEEEEG